MSKISRNDACPCGSGKKYKHCCLLQQESDAVLRQTEREQLQQQLPALISEGIRSFQNGDFEQSSQVFKQVLQNNPNDPDALHLLGVIARDQGLHEQAVTLIQGAIKVLPREANFFNNLGICYRQMGNLQQASECYEKAIELKPDHVQALNNLGNVYSQRGMNVPARQCLKRAIALQPTFADAHFNLGSVLQSLAELESALASYQRAIELRPNYAEALSNCGMVLFLLEREQEALNCFENAIRCQPDFAPAYANLGIMVLKKGLSVDALPLLQHADLLEPNNANTLNSLAIGEKNLGLFDQSIEHSKQAFRLSADSVAGLESAVRLALLCFLAHDRSGARHWLKLASKIVQLGELSAHAYWTVLGLLLTWQDRHPTLFLPSDQSSWYVIGESHALSLHGLLLNGMNGQALWIEGCKQWHLAKQEGNGYQQQFEAYLSALPPYSSVLICIGEIDCRIDEGIFKHWQTKSEQSLSDLISQTTQGYVAYVSKLKARYPHHITLCGVAASNHLGLDELPAETAGQYLQMLAEFNRQLQSAALQDGFGFLDLYTLSNRGDGRADGSWHLDRIHLQPKAYLEAFAHYWHPPVSMSR